MGEIENFIVCTIKRDLTKITLKISQQYLINRMTQGFNEDVKSLMNFNAPATLYKGILHNQEKDTNI